MLQLILAFVLAIASLPMPAAACEGPMPGAHAMSGMDHKAPMPPQHDCIGCAAVADWDGARVVPPAPIVAPSLSSRITALPLIPGQAPTPPPPRAA